MALLSAQLDGQMALLSLRCVLLILCGQ